MAENIQCCFQRYEKKYILSRAQQEYIMKNMRVRMVPDEYGQYTICSVYYDTPDWRLIRASLDKPVYKEKLRVRSYGVPAEDGRVFVELKKKFDGVVYKRRITMGAAEAAAFLRGEAAAKGQIGQEIAWFQTFYHTEPKVFIGYDRLAFTGREDPELRITFDAALRCRDENADLRAGDYGAAILPPDAVLMEIKIPGAAPLWLSRLLTDAGAFPGAFSKYGTFYKTHILNQTFHAKEAACCA